GGEDGEAVAGSAGGFAGLLVCLLSRGIERPAALFGIGVSGGASASWVEAPWSRNHPMATLDFKEKLILVIGCPSGATRAIAVLTPIMRPLVSSNGPPELPRFSPVSV